MSKSREMDTLADRAAPETLARAAKELGCMSIAYTYNDPVIFLEYAVDVAKACRKLGVKNVAVTAGYICEEPRIEFSRIWMRQMSISKRLPRIFYHKVTGSHLQPVLDTLKYIKHETSVWLEITTLLIPGRNDSETEIDEMTQWVVKELGPDVPMHFTAFHPDWKMLDVPATPFETLARAREIALKNGVRYAYTGNVHDANGESTYCRGCGVKLIGRDWYELSEWNLTDDGHCQSCGAQCSGVFDGPAGDWGTKRRPVLLNDYVLGE